MATKEEIQELKRLDELTEKLARKRKEIFEFDKKGLDVTHSYVKLLEEEKQLEQDKLKLKIKYRNENEKERIEKQKQNREDRKSKKIAEEKAKVERDSAKEKFDINSMIANLDERDRKNQNIANDLVSEAQKKSIKQRKETRSLAKDLVKITENEAGKLLFKSNILDKQKINEKKAFIDLAVKEKKSLVGQLEAKGLRKDEIEDLEKKIEYEDRRIDSLNSLGSIQKEILDDFGVGTLDFMEEDEILDEVLGVMGMTRAEFNKLGDSIDPLDVELFNVIKDDVTDLSGSTKVLSNKNFKDLYDAVENIETGFEGVIKGVDVFTGALVAPGMALKGLQLAATGLAVSFAKDIVESALSLRQELGVGVMESARLGANIKIGGLAAKVLGGDAEKVAEFAKEAANQFGTTSIFTKDIAEQVGILTATTGIGGAEAAKLAKAMGEVSGASLETNLQLIQTQGNLAKAQGLVPAKVLNDVANNTELFSDFAKDGGDNIFGAARAAAALGLELSTVAKTAEHLLDFEGSIEKQMEAQLLTGKQLNLDKARMLTLDGDLAGLAEEIKNQVGSQAEFEAMNVFQRRALAEAFGVTTKDLAAMISDGKTEAKIAADRVKLQEDQAENMQEMMKSQQAILEVMKLSQLVTTGIAIVTGTINTLKAVGLLVSKKQTMEEYKGASALIAKAAARAGLSAASVPYIGAALAIAAIAAVGAAGYAILRKPAPTGDLTFDAGTGAVETSMTEGALVTLPNGQQFQGTPNDSVMMGPTNNFTNTESFGPLDVPIPAVQNNIENKNQNENQVILNKIYEENKKTNMESRKLREQNELLLIKLIKTTGNEGYSTREAIGSLGRNN